MPQFLNRHGQTVAAEEALIGGKVLRDGYREIIGHGERVSFDLAFRDAASNSVFLTDTVDTAAQAAAVAYAKMVHDMTHSGPDAPIFSDADAAQAAARSAPNTQAVAAARKEFEDAADVAAAQAATARQMMIDDLTKRGGR